MDSKGLHLTDREAARIVAEERHSRRVQRILQVRDLAKEHAKCIREAVQERREAEELKLFEEAKLEVTAEAETSKQKLREKLEWSQEFLGCSNKYAERCMKEFAAKQARIEQYKTKALSRYQQSMQQLAAERKEKTALKELMLKRRKLAIDTANRLSLKHSRRNLEFAAATKSLPRMKTPLSKRQDVSEPCSLSDTIVDSFPKELFSPDK